MRERPCEARRGLAGRDLPARPARATARSRPRSPALTRRRASSSPRSTSRCTASRDPTSPLYQAGAERTFDLDLVNNTTGASGADGVIDPSGSYIINLTSLLTSRDNLREAAVDIVQLSKSLPNLDSTAIRCRTSTRTTSIISASRSAASSARSRTRCRSRRSRPTSTCRAAALPNLLRDSQALGPTINAGLAANGLAQGTTLYEQFFRDAQTVVDAGDPINYIAAPSPRGPCSLTQVLNDTVMPNSATQRLINAAPFVEDCACHRRQFRRGGHGHLGALHLGLARLAPEPRGEPRRYGRNADARSLARRFRGRRVRDHEPGHPGTLTTAEGGFFARLRARVNRGAAFVADLLPGRRIDAELLDELEHACSRRTSGSRRLRRSSPTCTGRSRAPSSPTRRRSRRRSPAPACNPEAGRAAARGRQGAQAFRDPRRRRERLGEDDDDRQAHPRS